MLLSQGRCAREVWLQVLNAVPETVQGVLVTAGGHGAAYCFRSANGGPLIKGFVPILQVKVSDTTGAGDAFLSGFLYSMVKVRLHKTTIESNSVPSVPLVSE